MSMIYIKERASKLVRKFLIIWEAQNLLPICLENLRQKKSYEKMRLVVPKLKGSAWRY